MQIICKYVLAYLSAVVVLMESHLRAAAGDALHLDFPAQAFTVKSVQIGGQVITCRAYEGVVYVARPVDTDYQCMNIYVPEAYFEGKPIGTFDGKSAPIFFPITVGGYMPAKPGRLRISGGQPGRADWDAITLALSKGLVVAAPGARGRTIQDKNGRYTGKAPACIVDLKAAVRYLRHNDRVIPGNKERIISNGTSAGGALSALLGATGDNPDYQPFLEAIGAARESDHIFAASCYCPITDLEHADAAYEWLFNGINTYEGMRGAGTLTPEQVSISGQLKSLFPEYLNSLNLKKSDGTALTLDSNGEGAFKDYVASFVIGSAQNALKLGKDLSGLMWLNVKDGKVTHVDLAKFAAYATRMKAPPAFDSLDLKSPENSLFGSATMNNRHFTSFCKANSETQAVAEPAIVKMMNPLEYIGNSDTRVARHWRLRHGTIDRDTSLAVPVILATRLQNQGATVDFVTPWAQGHGGDYDLDELFGWVIEVCH